MNVAPQIENRVLYVSPMSLGDVAFQERNLGLSVKQVTTEEFMLDVFGDFKGHLCIFQKKSNGVTTNTFYKKRDYERMSAFLNRTFGIDTYVSYSSYYKGKKTEKNEVLRTQKNIVHTYMLVQDLDYYKIGMSDAECLQQLGEMVRNGDIICPNYIVSTGQGYQLIWLVEPFKNISGFTNDRDWRAIQDHLYEMLRDFNSDTVVKNPSAVTRMPGTKHRKSQNLVYAFQANEAKFTLKDFLFFHNIIPTSDRIVKPKKVAKKATSISRMVENWNEYTLNRQREEDIFIYVRLQNERKQSYIGIRNWLALVLRYHALVSSNGDYDYAEQRVIQLCREMDMTETTEDELLRRSKPAERYYDEWTNDTWDRTKYVRGGLFYTNKRMLELMSIEDDYYAQWKMKTIKIKSKKYEAARKRFERLEKGQVQGTMDEYNKRRKEEALKNDNYLIVKHLFEEGKKQVDIIKQTGLSKGYVSKIIKKIKES